MLSGIRQLTIRVWVAITTFVIGVVLTMMWVVPRLTTEQPPAVVALPNPPQQQEIVVPAGWRQLEFNNKVFIMLPPDMQSAELFGDSWWYREAYSNSQIHLEIIGDVMVPEVEASLRERRVSTCDTPEILRNDPTYSESVIEIDGRQAKLGITHTIDRGIGATLCFPNADDGVFDVLFAAHCQDEQALATARQIFSSIRFKK